MSNIRVKVDQQNTKVRVGQQNALKITSSVSGGSAFADNSTNSLNVIGGIASVSQLNVSGVSTFTDASTFVGLVTFINDVYIGGNLYVDDNIVFDDLTARNANITGIVSVGSFIRYSLGEPYGIAYFDPNDALVSSGSPATAITETNYIFSTNSSGVPSWSNTIDGGVY